jgi:hypothetical protein
VDEDQHMYRFVGRDGYATEWRVVPKGGIPSPAKRERKKLGEKFDLQLTHIAKKQSSAL